MALDQLSRRPFAQIPVTPVPPSARPSASFRSGYHALAPRQSPRHALTTADMIQRAIVADDGSLIRREKPPR